MTKRKWNAEKALTSFVKADWHYDCIGFSTWLAEEVEETCSNCKGKGWAVCFGSISGILNFYSNDEEYLKTQKDWNGEKPQCPSCHGMGKIKVQRVEQFYEDVQE